MALQSSGAISIANIVTEFGGTAPHSLSEYYRGGGLTTTNNTNVPTSGSISLGNFYGGVRQFAFTISSNQTNANLRTLAVNAGWNQSDPVAATINSGVYISGNSTGTPALTVNGSFPGGVSLINNGFIVGMGGAGGKGGFNGGVGSGGGLALSVSSAISITNNGTVAGGGGGGGGGKAVYGGDGYGFATYTGGGGGGGRSSNAANSGAGARGDSGGSGTNFFGSAGGSGTVSSAGGGGGGGVNGPFSAGAGGAGGGWGSAGSAGGNDVGLDALTISRNTNGPFSGGSGGSAVSGNSNITWVATGTRLGAIT